MLNLRQLAKTISENKKVDAKVAKLILKNLSRKELIQFYQHLKTQVDKETVRILSSQPIEASLKQKLARSFPTKIVVFEKSDVGDGIKAVINDTIIDLTLTSYATTTVNNLKSTI